MKRIILMATAAVLLASCSKDSIRGSGSMGTRTLNLPAFTAVEAHYDIDAVITHNPNQQVVMTGYDNLLNILNVTVENGVLKLKFNTDYYNIRNSNVRAQINIPVLSRAGIYGSGNISISGFGNGNTLTTNIHGSGDVHISDSRYQQAVLDIFGSGKIDARNLQTREAQVNIFGSGDTWISVSDRLITRINGSGDVHYWGNPTVEISRNGSGRVIKK